MSENLRALLVVQPSVSHYRAPFVRALLARTGIDFELVGRVNRSAAATTDPVAASDAILGQVQELRRVQVFRALYWDRGLVSAVRRTTGRAIVIEGNVYGLSNWVAIAIARIRRRKVVFWGHAWKRPETGAKLALRKFFYQRADGHLTYGEWAPAYAGSVGLKQSTFVPVFNSIYPLERVAGQTARSGRPSAGGAVSLIYSGRLTPRHRADHAIAAVLELVEAGHAVRLDIVGDGEELARLKDLAAGSEQISFHGAVYDADDLARLYTDADFAVSPGATGLNVIQALGFGVPVIAAKGDPQSGPEIEAVRDAVTGFLYPAEEGSSGLKGALEAVLRMEDSAYAGLSKTGTQLVVARYTAEAHAEAMREALLRLSAGHSASNP